MLAFWESDEEGMERRTAHPGRVEVGQWRRIGWGVDDLNRVN